MIVAEAHNEARRILLEKRDVLETVTRRLLENEVMEGDELRAILDGSTGLPVDPEQGRGVAGAHTSDQTASDTATPATQSTA